MNREDRLYFITGVKQESYIYKYILALDQRDAKNIFSEKYPDYDIDEIKIISPSKKLMKEYSTILSKKI